MNKNRRAFIYNLGSSAIALPLYSLFGGGNALAADPPRLSPEDPTAKSLAYTHASTNAAKRCQGCQFFTGANDADWGPCVIFPGKLVNSRGLCNSWFAKAG